MRLLLAEDEKELSQRLGGHIKKHNHYSVDPVYNGLRPSLFTGGKLRRRGLDIMMPKMDGITVFEKGP